MEFINRDLQPLKYLFYIKIFLNEKKNAYEIAVNNLFIHLDKVEEILKTNRYLTGNQFTMADVRLFTTLYRFDPVYNSSFLFFL